MKPPTPAALGELERAIRHALETGDKSGLRILGYGEISTVVALATADVSYACKRLPPFADHQRAAAYARQIEHYVEVLTGRGLTVVATAVEIIEAGGGHVAFCLQPLLEPGRLLPSYLAEAQQDECRRLLGELYDLILGCITSRVGLDAQISNWAVDDRRGGALSYLDVTTPMLRDDAGREELDLEVHLSSLPWALRGFVRRFMVQSIMDQYFDPRATILDLLGNLHKERLTHLLPLALDLANERVTPPFSHAEVDRYYASDARLWAFLLALRRLDRFWQRRIRRRPYPFLLPGKIKR